MRHQIVFLTLLLIATFISRPVIAQEFTLQGKVTDENNNPLELVTVAVVSQQRVAFTNLKGEYSIQLHSADSVSVRFSMAISLRPGCCANPVASRR